MNIDLKTLGSVIPKDKNVSKLGTGGNIFSSIAKSLGFSLAKSIGNSFKSALTSRNAASIFSSANDPSFFEKEQQAEYQREIISLSKKTNILFEKILNAISSCCIGKKLGEESGGGIIGKIGDIIKSALSILGSFLTYKFGKKLWDRFKNRRSPRTQGNPPKRGKSTKPRNLPPRNSKGQFTKRPKPRLFQRLGGFARTLGLAGLAVAAGTALGYLTVKTYDKIMGTNYADEGVEGGIGLLTEGTTTPEVDRLKDVQVQQAKNATSARQKTREITETIENKSTQIEELSKKYTSETNQVDESGKIVNPEKRQNALQDATFVITQFKEILELSKDSTKTPAELDNISTYLVSFVRDNYPAYENFMKMAGLDPEKDAPNGLENYALLFDNIHEQIKSGKAYTWKTIGEGENENAVRTVSPNIKRMIQIAATEEEKNWNSSGLPTATKSLPSISAETFNQVYPDNTVTPKKNDDISVDTDIPVYSFPPDTSLKFPPNISFSLDNVWNEKEGYWEIVDTKENNKVVGIHDYDPISDTWTPKYYNPVTGKLQIIPEGHWINPTTGELETDNEPISIETSEKSPIDNKMLSLFAESQGALVAGSNDYSNVTAMRGEIPLPRDWKPNIDVSTVKPGTQEYDDAVMRGQIPLPRDWKPKNDNISSPSGNRPQITAVHSEKEILPLSATEEKPQIIVLNQGSRHSTAAEPRMPVNMNTRQTEGYSPSEGVDDSGIIDLAIRSLLGHQTYLA